MTSLLKVSCRGVEPKRTRKRRVVEELNYYTEEDLKAIFSLPVFTEGWRPTRNQYGDAPFWVPLIGYYTGARLEEICQLNVNSIREDKSGRSTGHSSEIYGGWLKSCEAAINQIPSIPVLKNVKHYRR